MPRIIIGADSGGPYELTEFTGGQPPFEIGSLERQALSYLGNWTRVKKRDEPFGVYYRFGVKGGVIDEDGDLVTVFLHFSAPFTKEGHAMTPEIQATLDQKLDKMIEITTVTFSHVVGNALGVRVSPPDYMLRELGELLRE